MIPLDLERFWNENAASLGKPFRTDKPRAPISLPFDDHWLLEELAVPSTVRFYHDLAYRQECHREGNRRCEEWVGIRPFAETLPLRTPRRVEELFGANLRVIEGGTPWLEPTLAGPDRIAAHLDHLESLGDAEFAAEVALPALPPAEGSHTAWTRGPATITTTTLGPTEALMLCYDEPDLMARWFRVLGETVVRYHRLLAGPRPVSGVALLDDDCALFSPDLYREFCLPVWRRLAAEFGSEMRYQHSDSAMAHLLPLLAELELTGCNFGPTVSVQTIRRAMPRTEIHGQLAPFTLRNGGPEAVEAEVRRDWEAVGADGGLLITTAGSIAAGTPLAAVRHWMSVVDQVCRY